MKSLLDNMKLNRKIQVSLLLIIAPIFILFLMLFGSIYNYNAEYSRLLANASQAGEFSINFKQNYDDQMHHIISGHATFIDRDPYGIIGEARTSAWNLWRGTRIGSNQTRAKEIIGLLDDLERYTQTIEQNKSRGWPYDMNVSIWEKEIRIVTTRIQNIALEYIYHETQGMEQYRSQISSILNRITAISSIIFSALIAAGVVLSIVIPNSITKPIRSLNDATAQVARLLSPIEHMLEGVEKSNMHRITVSRNDEIGKISNSFNQMADTIYVLVNNLEETVRERTAELEENKEKLQIILDSTAEAVYGIDRNGKCTFCNASCVRMLGYSHQGELLGKSMHQQIHHSRSDFSEFPEDECRILRALAQGESSHADDEVFWKADDTSIAVEYHSYPQFKDGSIIGAVVTFTDNTERKKAEEQIRYLSNHDALTGLFNRAYFEEALKQIDTNENLPISIVYGDVNGLKLTNDVFGHAAGDALIQKSAEILKTVSRKGDIIARVGGDEMIILLPHTEAADAARIIERVKSELYNEQIDAIRCSISMGLATKTEASQIIERTILIAEHAMYRDKIANREMIHSGMIETIIRTLHERCPHEKRHSKVVGAMCKRIGQAMKLPENDVKKLEQAGYLHDIGKIVLNADILERYGSRTEEEKKEMQRHAIVGYRILNLFDDTLDLADDIYYHHECWDGSGYPKGLKGGEIPLIARIIAVAEAYDAMTSNMYQNSMSESKALDEIKRLAGTRFDPAIVSVFVDMMNGVDHS